MLLAALPGRADILATSDVDLRVKEEVIAFEGTDPVILPFSNQRLVIAKPSFVAYWLRRGIIPDARQQQS